MEEHYNNLTKSPLYDIQSYAKSQLIFRPFAHAWYNMEWFVALIVIMAT